MDQSKALQKLTEAADLVGMVEDIIRTSQSERVSSATTSGMRITLRNVREAILASHDVFAGELVSRNRARTDVALPAMIDGAHEPAVTAGGMSDPSKLGMRRQSLRASLEKLAE